MVIAMGCMMRWGSPHPGKEERVGRGVAQMGKDREGHRFGEPCVVGAVGEAVGASWGGLLGRTPALTARDRVQKGAPALPGAV